AAIAAMVVGMDGRGLVCFRHAEVCAMDRGRARRALSADGGIAPRCHCPKSLRDPCWGRQRAGVLAAEPAGAAPLPGYPAMPGTTVENPPSTCVISPVTPAAR